MKTFKELQEGDKIFIWADKPYLGCSKSTYYYVNEPFISGIYEIEKARKMGFCIRFSLRDIIGSKIYTYVNTNDLVLSARMETCIKRTLQYYDRGEYCQKYCQNILITTSEEEWLEKMEEN